MFGINYIIYCQDNGLYKLNVVDGGKIQIGGSAPSSQQPVRALITSFVQIEIKDDIYRILYVDNANAQLRLGSNRSREMESGYEEDTIIKSYTDGRPWGLELISNDAGQHWFVCVSMLGDYSSVLCYLHTGDTIELSNGQYLVRKTTTMCFYNVFFDDVSRKLYLGEKNGIHVVDMISGAGTIISTAPNEGQSPAAVSMTRESIFLWEHQNRQLVMVNVSNPTLSATVCIAIGSTSTHGEQTCGHSRISSVMIFNSTTLLLGGDRGLTQLSGKVVHVSSFAYLEVI